MNQISLKKLPFFTLLLYLLITCCQNKNTNDIESKYSPEVENRINRIINNLQVQTSISDKYDKGNLYDRLKYYATPGISIAVINEGKIEWTRGFGVKEWGKKDPVTKNTLFQAASISKPIFAIAVMRLKERKILDIDEDVNKILKSWKIPLNNNWQPKITLRQLLSHTAGLTVHGFPGYMKSESIPSIIEILDGQFPANTSPINVNIIPGTRLRYSGGGITVAQLVIQDILNKPFNEIMDNEIINVLGLKNSTYEQPLSKKKKKYAAVGHPWKYQPIKGKYHIYPEQAAAGLWTTSSDLAEIAVEIQKAVKGESNLISQEVVNEMLAPQKISNNIGIGFFISGKGDSVIFSHGGWNEGYVSRLIAYKKRGKGAAIMLNSNQGNEIIDEIIRAIALEYEWIDFQNKHKSSLELNERMINKYVGTYKSDNGLEFLINGKGKSLFLTLKPQEPIEIFAENKENFYSNILNIQLVFKKNNKNSIIGFDLNQEGTILQTKRVK